jgi:hypothetical protein
MRKFLSKILAFIYLVPCYLSLFQKKYLVAAFIAFGLSILIMLLEAGIRSEASFIDRVKSKLGVSFVHVSIRKRSRKGLIGGFMIPILPFFVKIKYFEPGIKAESIIHELAHIYFFVHKFQLVAIFLLAYLSSIISSPVFTIFIMVSFLCVQEYLAFTKTQKIAESFGMKTRAFNIKMLVKYILVYALFISSIFFCFGILGFLVWPICLALLIILVVLIDRLLPVLFKMFDKVVL